MLQQNTQYNYVLGSPEFFILFFQGAGEGRVLVFGRASEVQNPTVDRDANNSNELHDLKPSTDTASALRQIASAVMLHAHKLDLNLE